MNILPLVRRMQNDDVDFEASLNIIQNIQEGLRKLDDISPCTKKNCPHTKQFDETGDCPNSCQFLSLRNEKNKLYSSLCGS